MSSHQAISMKDVAKHCGVSVMTVSNVVNRHPHVSSEIRERVSSAIRELNYIPDAHARNLIMRKPKRGRRLLGGLSFAVLLWDEIRKFQDSYSMGVIRGIDDEIRENGHFLTFMDSYENLDRNPVMLNSLLSPETVDGILTFVGPDKGLVFEHIARTAPLVHIDELNGYDYVTSDKDGAMRQVVDYLTGLGHREIGFLGGTGVFCHGYDSRYSAFKMELESRGIPCHKEWFIGDDFGFGVGQAAAKELLTRESLPTAVFCGNDRTAIGAIHVFLSAGIKIPEQLSVVGFNDVPEAALFYPPLTTVNASMEEIGRLAVRRLLEKLEDPSSEPRYQLVPTKLVKRMTCASPASQNQKFPNAWNV